jgi:hypothetical protein
VPAELSFLLADTNGFVAWDGGLHVRGVCSSPEWHDLSHSWSGARALHRLFDAVLPSDVPFAEDCMGDQFVLRSGMVHRLSAETGELEPLDADLAGFFAAAEANPVEYLSLQPLMTFQKGGTRLQPGQLLHAYPPFCAEESAGGVSLRAAPALDVIQYLSDLSRFLAKVPKGSQYRITLKNLPMPPK